MVRFLFAVGAFSLLDSTSALAHSRVPGVNAFTAGLIEPFFQPALIVGVVALAVLMGGAGVRHLSPVFAAFILALVVGMLARWYAPLPLVRLSLIAAVAVCAGGLAALNRPVPRLVGLALALISGTIAGFELAPHEPEPWSRITSGLGSWLAVTLLFLNVAAFAIYLCRCRYEIVLRVAGSWCAAIGMLLAGQVFLR